MNSLGQASLLPLTSYVQKLFITVAPLYERLMSTAKNHSKGGGKYYGEGDKWRQFLLQERLGQLRWERGGAFITVTLSKRRENGFKHLISDQRIFIMNGQC